MTPHLAADLAVTLADDRPGMLAKAIGCVSAAKQSLIAAGFRVVQQQQVALVPVADEPGAAARVFQKIANAHINVRYSYLATRNRLVIAADKPQAIIEALKT